MEFWREKSHRTAFQHSRLLTAHHSKSFYLSARMLPREKRWATFALYGFCRYADNLIDNPRQRQASELIQEVDYLATELEIAYRTGESEHPVIQPFIVVAKRYGIPIAHPIDLLRGVKMDIQKDQYATFDELYVFCYRVAAVVGIMMTHVLGYANSAAFKYAEKLGIAMQLTNILRDVQEDQQMGRIYLPTTELARFGVQPSDIAAGRMTPRLRELMQFQVDRAHEYYEEAHPGIAMLDTEAQFAIYSASTIYRGILRKIEARGYDPFLGRVFVPQSQKLRILLRQLMRTKLLLVQERLRPVHTMR